LFTAEQVQLSAGVASIAPARRVGSALCALLVAALALSPTGHASPRIYERAANTVFGAPGRDPYGFDTQRHAGSSFVAVNVGDLRNEGGRNGADSERGWIKFRLDLEYDILRIERRPRLGYWYLTFPLGFTGFWDAFNTHGNVSSPVVEIDYQPGLELSWAASPSVSKLLHYHRAVLSVGVRHESNGLGLFTGNDSYLNTQSRSWNQLYLAFDHSVRPWSGAVLTTGLQVWYAFGRERVFVWPNGSTTHRKIQQYAGYAVLQFTLRQRFARWADFVLRAQIRQRSFQLELRWKIQDERVPGLHEAEQSEDRAELNSQAGAASASAEVPDNYFRLDLLAHCFFGKAERLIVANESRYACYLGLGF
jgi:outer membrane phospholipase A